MPVTLEYKTDHLLVRLVGRSALTAARRNLVLPYSDIVGAQVEPPRWPSFVKEWSIGTHLPRIIAHGYFSTWNAKQRRFLHIDRDTQRVLTIRLEGHPDLDEVSVEVNDPDAAQKEIAGRARR